MRLIELLIPETFLGIVACALLLLGCSNKAVGRRLAAPIAVLALLLVFLWQARAMWSGDTSGLGQDEHHTVGVFALAQYVKLIAAGVGAVLLLLAWPSDREGTGNSAINYGNDGGEFFALSLFSILGVFLVASANDIILLFLALELVSLPTYVMVSISRPAPAAQEAGVKYFFLGAMSAALMLFGFTYLYGTSGSIYLHEIAASFASTAGESSSIHNPTAWQLLGVLMLLAGLAYKIAAVPLHFYAGDVYEGAATPVTGFLAFVPKLSGFVAIAKVLQTVGGDMWLLPPDLIKLLWIIAVLTMFTGNVLGLLQQNIKRVMAYSSIAHSGYMLAALAAAGGGRDEALSAVLFYLLVYGLMNAGVFAGLILLPSRGPNPATSAETFHDITGQGRRHVGLGLGMAVCLFGLTGLPFTAGFIGKVLLIRPLVIITGPAAGLSKAAFVWLAVLLVVNAAISAAYYLRIVAALFLRSDPDAESAPAAPSFWPVRVTLLVAVICTLALGMVPQAIDMTITAAREAAGGARTVVPAP